MAIDSEEKRKSAAHVAEYGNPITVKPELAKSQEWRQTVAWSYYGITADSTAGVTVKNLPLLGVG